MTNKTNTNGKTWNINAMYPVLENAHYANNRKAISKDDVEKAGVSLDYFDDYKRKVESCYSAVTALVREKNVPAPNLKKCKTLRNKIYPEWKALLECAEDEKTVKKLHVSEFDVDSLVGYCEAFIKSNVGTQMACNTKSGFRKLVESLLGCRIAQCSCLSDEDRDLIKEDNGYSSTIKKADKEKAEHNETIKKLQALIKPNMSKDFKEHLEKAIQDEKDAIKLVESTIDKAKADKAKIADKIRILEARIKDAAK